MNIATKILLAAAFMSMPFVADAQSENPRGIFMMTSFTGKLGEMKAPYEQYKICTDSVTLQVVAQGNVFQISDNDHQPLYFTGEQAQTAADRSTRIYESYSDGFKLKWWSNFRGHLYYPENDWCVEQYEKGQYSGLGSVYFNALTGKSEPAKKKSLLGTWVIIGGVDELSDIQAKLPSLAAEYPKSKYLNSYIVFAPQSCTIITPTMGNVAAVSAYSKRSFTVENTVKQVTWLSKNSVAIEVKETYRTSYMILYRLTDGSSPLEHIAAQYVYMAKQ